MARINVFDCAQCGLHKQYESDFTTGYGTSPDGSKVCYQCIGENEARELSALKAGEKHILYLTKDASGSNRVTNWPNSFSRPVYGLKKSWHNIARNRYDFWFMHDGREFHGVQYGDNTQIAHCKPLRKAS